MTERELKKRLKKLSIVVVGVILAIGILLIYTFANQKADLSIYTNAGGYVDNLQALGINENEFKEYLSIFGNLINHRYQENEKTLKMATNFIENMYASYEVQIAENGLKTYDADIVKKIAQETQGTYLKEDAQGNGSFTYDKEKNTYSIAQKEETDTISYCTEIKDIIKKEDKIEVIYQLGMMTKEQMAAYKTGKNVEFETYTVKATIMKNSDYVYSKYFINSIEEI